MSTLIYGLFMTCKRIHHSLRCIHIHQIHLIIAIQNEESALWLSFTLCIKHNVRKRRCSKCDVRIENYESEMWAGAGADEKTRARPRVQSPVRPESPHWQHPCLGNTSWWRDMDTQWSSQHLIIDKNAPGQAAAWWRVTDKWGLINVFCEAAPWWGAMRPHVWHVSLLALAVSLRLYTCLCPPACLCSDEGHVAVTCINSSLEVNS